MDGGVISGVRWDTNGDFGKLLLVTGPFKKSGDDDDGSLVL